jgi:hypothetical protein
MLLAIGAGEAAGLKSVIFTAPPTTPSSSCQRALRL